MRLAKSTRLSLGAILVSLLSVWSLSVMPNALAWSRPTDLNMSGVNCPESPNCQVFEVDMAAESNRVHLIYIQNNSKRIYYHRGTTNADGSITWENGRAIAQDVSSGDDGIAIAADNNGTIHVAYSSGKTLYYIKNTAHGDFGNWSNPERAAGSNGRVNNIALALDADQSPYISWDQNVNPSNIALAYRKGDGTWTSRNLGANQFLYRNPKMTVTGRGDAAVVHILSEFERQSTDNFFRIAYARGPRAGDISVSNWSTAFNDNGSDERPFITVDPVTNVIYGGFVDGSPSRGYDWTFSSSADNGQTWSSLARASLGGSFWADFSPMVAYNGTLYIMLSQQADGANGKIGFYDVRYTQATNSFSTPQTILNYADSNNKIARETAYAITSNAKVAVWIRNYVDGPGYNTDPGGIDLIVKPSGQVVINNGADSTNNPTLNIAINSVNGNPSSMRVSVDTPLTDATPVESYKQTFTRTLSDLSACTHTVYVQLINDTKGLVSDVSSDSIVVDSQVQADAVIRNPYKRGNAVVFSQLQQTAPLVTDGDAEYTRVAAFYIEVNGAAECSQLSKVRVGRTANALPLEYTVASNFFANVLPIPGQLVIGSNTIVLQVEDSVGNTQVFSREIKYDPTPPTLVTSGTLSINVPTTGPNILASLSVSGDEIQDNMYPGRGFWGVWVANSRTPIADPANDATLTWQPVAVNGTTSEFTLANWSLLGGLTADQQTPGDYYVYLRFLDGAGNPTNGFLVNKVNLSAITKPQTSLPVVIKP